MADDLKFEISPALKSFVSRFGSEGGKDWAAEAAARVQAHYDAQGVAAAQEQARNNFIRNLDSTKQDLISLARNDPSAHGLALDLAEITMKGLTGALGGQDEHHNAILGHMQGEIAHAAIQGLAARDEGAARSALSTGRLSSLIPDDQRGPLDQYITAMAQQRATDNVARQQEVVRQHMLGSNRAATEWLGGMTDPQTGQLWFPDNWGQRMLQDERLSPWDRAGLHSAYRNLITNGNPIQSDPDLVHSLLDRAALPHNDPANPSVGEIIGHVGQGLTMADAQFIASRAGPQTPEVDGYTSRISDAMGDAKAQIDNPSAFGRFVNWLMPALRSGADLDPSSKTYALTPERMATFQPTGDDVIAPALRAYFDHSKGPTEDDYAAMQYDAPASAAAVERSPIARGFAMRSDQQAGGVGQNLREVAPRRPTLGEIFSGALPGAGTFRAAKIQADTMGMTPEQQDQYAYAHPEPVIDKANQPPPNVPQPALGGEVNPEDLQLSDGTNVGPVTQ